MKKIVINGRFLTQRITGVQRFSVELVKALDNSIEENKCFQAYEWFMVAPHKIIHNIKLKNIKIKEIGKLKGHLWEQLELPYYSKGSLLINFCNTGPILKRHQIVTIHDAAVFSNPEGYTKKFVYWYKFLYYTLTRKVHRIITVSEFSKKELIHYCKISKDRINVISEGYEQVQRITANTNVFEKHKINPNRYIFAVSSLNPNKNFQGIVEAVKFLKNIEAEIVIAGGVNPKVFDTSNNTLSNNVKYIGYVTDEELKALYENAIGFIYPSFYEGFGLPPLEAMACGCPVIVSNAASLPEVCGDAALYVDPYNPKDIAEKIKILISDDSLREELHRKGLERAQFFTWKKSAKEIKRIIKEVIEY